MLALRVGVFGGLYWWKLRDADDDVQWAYAWVALLALHPQIWWHYLALLVPAMAYMVASRSARAAARGRPAMDHRIWWLIPAVAGLTLPLVYVVDTGTLRLYAPILLLVAAVTMPFVADA